MNEALPTPQGTLAPQLAERSMNEASQTLERMLPPQLQRSAT